MSRLWAWVLRLTTMRQENDRLIRRTEKLTARQRVLTEESEQAIKRDWFETPVTDRFRVRQHRQGGQG